MIEWGAKDGFVVNMKIELLFDIEPIQRRIDLSYIVILDA